MMKVITQANGDDSSGATAERRGDNNAGRVWLDRDSKGADGFLWRRGCVGDSSNRAPRQLTFEPVHLGCYGGRRVARDFIRRSFSSAWWRRDFTVPTEIPRAAAISGNEASWKNRSRTT